jgi:hypothetical protein
MEPVEVMVKELELALAQPELVPALVRLVLVQVLV